MWFICAAFLSNTFCDVIKTGKSHDGIKYFLIDRSRQMIILLNFTTIKGIRVAGVILKMSAARKWTLLIIILRPRALFILTVLKFSNLFSNSCKWPLDAWLRYSEDTKNFKWLDGSPPYRNFEICRKKLFSNKDKCLDLNSEKTTFCSILLTNH